MDRRRALLWTLAGVAGWVLLVASIFVGVKLANRPSADGGHFKVQAGIQPAVTALCDGVSATCNVTGVAGNPLVTTGSGGGGSSSVSVINDAGNAVPVSAASLPLPTGAAQDTTLTGGTAKVQVINDAGNSVPVTVLSAVSVSGTAAVDPFIGSESNTLVVGNTAGTGFLVVDAGTKFLFDINFTNEGTVNGWAQCYCGQYVLDAGGTANAATVPNLQLRCPSGSICGLELKAALSCAGMTCYSSAAAGTLTTASAPNMTLTAAAIR